MSNTAIRNDLSMTTLPAFGVRALTLQFLLLVSAAFVLPAVTHALGLPIRALLPMHWPVLLAGLCYGWRSGLAIGLAVPAVSFALSGMPPAFMLPAMTLELACYGFVAGFSREKLKLNLFLSTFIALIAGRIVFLAFLMGSGAQSLPFLVYLQSAMLPGLAAALGQLLLLPLIARRWVGGR